MSEGYDYEAGEAYWRKRWAEESRKCLKLLVACEALVARVESDIEYPGGKIWEANRGREAIALVKGEA